jgi:alpha-D-ribose 1-methylphosphonate 5-triphosphate synthase subunit PhnH
VNTLLATTTPGFVDPVHGAQRTFRVVLDAMSRPGSIRSLPPEAIAGIEPPPPVGIASTAILLALLDAETVVSLVGPYDNAGTSTYLRFHTGARIGTAIEDAAFTLVHARELDAPVWSRLACGSDEAPQDGATLIVEVERFGGSDATALTLRGPGIERETRLAVAGPSPAFWAWRIALQSRQPRGVDLILACGGQIVCVPRSTHVTIDAGSA